MFLAVNVDSLICDFHCCNRLISQQASVCFHVFYCLTLQTLPPAAPACLTSASVRLGLADWGWRRSATANPLRTWPRLTRACTNGCVGTWRRSQTNSGQMRSRVQRARRRQKQLETQSSEFLHLLFPMSLQFSLGRSLMRICLLKTFCCDDMTFIGLLLSAYFLTVVFVSLLVTSCAVTVFPMHMQMLMMRAKVTCWGCGPSVSGCQTLTQRTSMTGIPVYIRVC